MNHSIYLDNSATTPTAPEVVEAMSPYFSASYGNASSLHTLGRRARRAVEESRGTIAGLLGAEPEEIVFTAGATEANNLAILGTARSSNGRKHLITTAIEHHAVLHTVQWLRTQGFDATILDVDATGRVDPEQVRDAIRPDTLLVSVMTGNNEIGTLQPIDEIGRICRQHGVLMHTDAVQAFGKVRLPMDAVDLLSISAHKFHGPKGIGFLFVRKGVKLAPILHGGGHEGGRRSGTENVPGIVGTAAAAQLAIDEQAATASRLRALRERMLDQVMQLPGTRLNGHREESLPHIANFSFEAIEGESLVMRLDERGIAVSTGSACSSPTLEPSHVLVAIGVPISMAHGSLRISTGRQTTAREIDEFLGVLPEVVDGLRSISPFKVGG
jgi:cysteine desulfurase